MVSKRDQPTSLKQKATQSTPTVLEGSIDQLTVLEHSTEQVNMQAPPNLPHCPCSLLLVVISAAISHQSQHQSQRVFCYHFNTLPWERPKLPLLIFWFYLAQKGRNGRNSKGCYGNQTQVSDLKAIHSSAKAQCNLLRRHLTFQLQPPLQWASSYF